VFGAIGFTYLTSTYLAMNDRFATVFFTSASSIDFVSDVAYVTQVKFYNKSVFILAVIALFLSLGHFVLYVVRKKVRPTFFAPFPGTYLSPNVWWLSSSKGSPFIDGKAAPGGFEEHSNLPKFVVFCFRWLVVVIVQVLFCGFYAAYVCVHIAVWWGPMMLLGCFLFQLKSICVKRVWNVWVSLFTLTPTTLVQHSRNMILWWNNTKLVDPDGELYKHWKSCDVADTDAGMFNESLLVEFFLEAIPQLLLQGLNNYYTFQWGDPITKFSFVMSALIVINGLWSLGYPVIFDGLAINDVPLRLKVCGYVIQIKTESSRDRMGDDGESARRNLAFRAWRQLVDEFNRLTAMRLRSPEIAASADAVLRVLYKRAVVNEHDLTPKVTKLLVEDLEDNATMQIFCLCNLRKFDEVCQGESEQRCLEDALKQQAQVQLEQQDGQTTVTGGPHVYNPMAESMEMVHPVNGPHAAIDKEGGAGAR
jgi:hypothetical protein